MVRLLSLALLCAHFFLLGTPANVGAQGETTRGYAPVVLPETIPIFPLEDVMLFPRATRPLHIFEQRYRDMVDDALEGDRLIGMVLLEPGYEADYEDTPPVFPIGCVGIITEAEKLPDGRYNIVIGGLSKFRITAEDHSRPYRMATIELIPDELSANDRDALEDLRDELTALVPVGLPGLQVPAGLNAEDLVNGISQLIDIEPRDRLGLLEQPHALARGRALLDILYIRASLLR